MKLFTVINDDFLIDLSITTCCLSYTPSSHPNNYIGYNTEYTDTPLYV